MLDPAELRALRHTVGNTLERASAVLGCSIEKLSYLERGLTQNHQFMTIYRDYLTADDTLPTTHCQHPSTANSH